MTKITVNNFFNSTDISIYNAVYKDGVWAKGAVIARLIGNERSEINVESDGIYVTYWKAALSEFPLGSGYIHMTEYCDELDVFDIRAGNMPSGFYASWRCLYLA
ncbi:MAG: hypothetical protein ABJN69_07700 [Hellea sp.]